MSSVNPVTVLVSPLAPRGRSLPRQGEAVRCGLPFGRGLVPGTPTALTLTDAAGGVHTGQGRVLDRWPDGSVRWLLVDAQVDHHGGEAPVSYALTLTPAVSPRTVVQVDIDGSTTSVRSGALAWHLRPGTSFPFGVSTAEVPLAFDHLRSGLSISAGGVEHGLRIGAVTVEDAGPVRAVVRVDAAWPAVQALAGIQVSARLHVEAGASQVRCEVTVRNTEPAVHPGGYWDLGDPHARLFEDVSLVLAWPEGDGAVSVSCSPDEAAAPVACGERVSLFQASSGGERWNYRTHVNAKGDVPLAFRGYRGESANGAWEGDRATPLVVAQRGDARLGVVVPQFWQNFPQAIEAGAAGVRVRLLPRQHGEPHELQPGEQKTWTVVVAWGEDAAPEGRLAWARSPLLARATPAHYCGSGALSYLLPLDENPDRDHATLVTEAIDGPQSFVAKREVIDEYGWRNFGDLYADHEGAYYTGAAPIVSHYNNQYDAVAGMALQFLRSGDVRWWQPMVDLAQHVVDIDLYHTTRDRAIYDHGLFWHSAHYMDAGRATHRAYTRAPGIFGGGPANEHCYAAGLMLHAFLTGSTASREAAVELAQWVIDMDDGRKRVFRWLAGGDTGFASASGSPLYHGPGRGAGNAIGALLTGLQLTGERRFLDKVEALIRRCIHPADDIAARDLLNIEARWSYTVFLHALGRYLDLKGERGELDERFAYAQQALLAYARWMDTHERPYLERAAELEYPTETWAVQDLWKSEVFAFAARYAGEDDELRARCLERAEFFFRYAMTALPAMPTRTSTRPLVLLLSRGLMHGYLSRRPEALQVRVPSSVPLPPPLPPFEPQKVRAIRRFWWLAGASIGVVGLGLAWLVAHRFGLV